MWLGPQLGVGSAQFLDQFRGHLTQRLRLARELAEVVAVTHPAAAEALTGMAGLLRPAVKGDLRDAHR